MIYIGNNITAFNENMQRIHTKLLYEKIKYPLPDLQSKISQLRTVLSIDPVQYRKQKITLPYFTCGLFTPPFRRRENFSAIKCFVIDIDHIEQGQQNLYSLRAKLIADERVHLLFCSPSNDGLKVMFMLEEPFYDAAQYSIFYKLFAKKLAIQYHIENVLDIRTSDVTRACFLSADADAYYNETCTRIVGQKIIDFDNTLQVEEAQQQIKQDEKELNANPLFEEAETRVTVNDDQIKKIKEALGMRVPVEKPQKQYFVPEELEKIVSIVKAELEPLGINLKSVNNINYGKKFVFELGLKWAELNMFYGKRGYTVVITPKSGSSKELAEVVYTILIALF